MTESHTLFRLRIKDTIVGYMKLFSSGIKNYSKDQFWWHGEPIEYDYKDQYSGQLDRNNRPLFEHDVVAMRTTTKSNPKSNCYMYFCDERNAFVLEQIDNQQVFELFAGSEPLFHKSELTFVGFHFNNDTD